MSFGREEMIGVKKKVRRSRPRSSKNAIRATLERSGDVVDYLGWVTAAGGESMMTLMHRTCTSPW